MKLAQRGAETLASRSREGVSSTWGGETDASRRSCSSTRARHGHRSTTTMCAGVLLLAGCRDVLGVSGWKLTKPDAAKDHSDAAAKTSCARAPEDLDAPIHESGARCDSITYPDAGSDCKACIDSACCDAAQDCNNDRTCRNLAQCLAGCGIGDTDADQLCRVQCNLGNRRTSAMSRLTVCAAARCTMCAVARPTYGGLECEKCTESAPNNLALSVLARDYDLLELESCLQDCPPGYRNPDDCHCDDYACRATNLSSLIAPGCKSDCTETQDWSCLGHVKAPVLRDGSDPLHLHVMIKDVVGDVVHEPRIWVCGFADSQCATPLTGPFTTHDDGFVDIPISRRFAGEDGQAAFSALRVEWDASGSMVPSSALLPFDPPIVRSPSWTLRRVVDRLHAQSAADALGLSIDWEHNGGIIFSVATCNGLAAQFVKASLNPVSGSTEPAYYSRPDLTIDPQLQWTREAGTGAFINVKSGDRVLTLTWNDMRVGEYRVPVVAGTITVLALAPAENSSN